MRALNAVLFLACPLCLLWGGSALAAEDELTVTSDQQTALTLTIYEQNLALVQDRRMVKLNEGLNRIAFAGVSAQLAPETVLIDQLTGEPLHLVEQRYERDLLTPNALLAASVGHDIRIAIRNPQTGEDRIENATVLSAAQGVVLKMGDRIETTLPGRLVYASVPADLRDKPTLQLTLVSLKGGSLPVEISYLTSGLEWSANYVAALDESETKLSLSGRASVSNASGTSYPKARMTLVAGALHRVSRVAPRAAMVAGAAPMMAAAAPAPPPLPRAEALSEYYRFPLDREISLGEHETIQLALIEAPSVPVKKEYRLEDEAPVAAAVEDEPTPLKIQVRLSLENDKASGLGTPLPSGVVRIYRHGADGSVAFVGEDDIDATAAGRPVRLTLGQAFDVSAERRQTSASRPSDKSYEASEEITLHNAKATSVAVTVVETLPGDWRILQESDPHEAASASTARWHLDVPAKGERKLTYRVLTRY
ncbi:MAG TPA: DUF4139 domain-containing protein [Alphaproteobacteria bacterium]|nr:DUF4139 domain-containing protein [Alphaproteobacteria bacterium]